MMRAQLIGTYYFNNQTNSKLAAQGSDECAPIVKLSPFRRTLIWRVGMTAGIGPLLSLQNDRTAIGHDQAGPDQEHARLPESDLAIIDSDQARTLRDQARAASWGVIDALMIPWEHAEQLPITDPTQLDDSSKIYLFSTGCSRKAESQSSVRRSDAVAGRHPDDQGDRRYRDPARHLRPRPHHRRQERTCELAGDAVDVVSAETTASATMTISPSS
jgi:hypothetical protein